MWIRALPASCSWGDFLLWDMGDLWDSHCQCRAEHRSCLRELLVGLTAQKAIGVYFWVALGARAHGFWSRKTEVLGGKSNARNSLPLGEETEVCGRFFMDAAKPNSFIVLIPNLAWNSLPLESWVRNVLVTGFTARFHNLWSGNRSTNSVCR